MMMGTLFWVSNSWALIMDDDPATRVDLAAYLHAGLADGHIQALDPGGDGRIPIAGGTLVRGNGDQDDNREERPLLHLVSAVVVPPRAAKAVSNFSERRTAVAYKDFGHLKIMPAGDNIDIEKRNQASCDRRLPVYYGRPSVVRFVKKFHNISIKIRHY